MALKGGTRFKVTMADVFPNGCNLVPAPPRSWRPRTTTSGQGDGPRPKTRSPVSECSPAE